MARKVGPAGDHSSAHRVPGAGDDVMISGYRVLRRWRKWSWRSFRFITIDLEG